MFVFLQRLVPQHLLSRLVAMLARSQFPPVRGLFIRIFTTLYSIDLAEAARKSERDYVSFNDFFTRELAPGARPVSGAVSSPADGTVSACGRLDGNTILQAKGRSYRASRLLGRDAREFDGGSFITIYLAPTDYHRVHCPFAATVTAARYVPGRLFSVNDTTANGIQDLFAINERLACDLDTAAGPAAMVMVGAMIVAGIRAVWNDGIYPPGKAVSETPDRAFAQGDEFGHFEMGSTVIIVTAQAIDWRVAPGDTVRVGMPLAD